MSEEIAPQFGERLESARQQAGLSKAATCRLLDIALASYANYEKNRTTPTPERQAHMLKLLAHANDITAAPGESPSPVPYPEDADDPALVEPPDDADDLPDAGSDLPPERFGDYILKPVASALTPPPAKPPSATVTSVGHSMSRFFAPPALLPAPPPVEYAPRLERGIPEITKRFQPSPVDKPVDTQPKKLVWRR